MFISGKKIKENKQLNLNEKYRVIKYQGFTFDEQVEYLLIGPEYNIIFYEEKSISKATLDYYGDVESLEKINDLWVGKLAQYHKISGKDYLGRELFYLGEVGQENHKKFLENYREYFTDKNLNDAADELITKEIITKISNELPSSSKLKKISISNIASTIKEMKNASISPDDLRKVAKANISEQEIFDEIQKI